MITPVGGSTRDCVTAEGRSAHGLTRAELLGRAAVSAVGLFAMETTYSARASARTWPGASAYAGEVPTAWFDLALRLVQTTPGFSPPVASRAFGYSGVALYEALAPGIAKHRSFTGVLNGLSRAPLPADAAYHWPTVASSALATILRLLFPTTPASNGTAIDELERRFAANAQATLPFGIYKRSVARGARGLPARSFGSFTAAAEEAAISRLYGGIHFREAIERGLEQGARIGARVTATD